MRNVFDPNIKLCEVLGFGHMHGMRLRLQSELEHPQMRLRRILQQFAALRNLSHSHAMLLMLLNRVLPELDDIPLPVLP
jgi:hypothetical protein